MGLAAVRDIRPQLRLDSPDEIEAFEQDLLAEFVLARASAGITDTTISADVAAVVGLREWFGRPLWEMTARDLDRYFGVGQRGLAAGTKVRKAAAFAVFFEFLELRHKSAIHAATGFVVESPLDEVNRPRGGTSARLRIPPGEREIDKLFTGWRTDMLTARKYAPAARNYTAMRLASLIGPRVSELCLLTMRDVCWDLGRFGKILLHGKGSRGRGKKDRLVPLINGSRDLLEWWAGGPRWEFDDRVNDPAAPLFPSERRYGDGSSRPVTDDALRLGLADAVAAHLPAQARKLTPHLLRHYAASELYRNGMDVFAVQEVLGHEWINTTMIYVNPRELHQTGVIREVCPGTKGRNEVPTAHLSSFVTSGYATTSPSDARSARQPEKIINEDERVSRIGEHARRSQGSTWLPGHPLRVAARGVRRACAEESLPNGPFGWLEYLSPPVHVHRSHVEDAWVQAGRRAAGRLGGQRS